MIRNAVMTDTEMAAHSLPWELVRQHSTQDTESIVAAAKIAVGDLSCSADDEEFLKGVPKTLALLALLDHLTDRRTIGMIFDYMNF